MTGRMRTTRWILGWRRSPNARMEKWAYAYPARRAAWKNTIEVFHTAGEPPRIGRIIFATIGWTRKTRPAPRQIAAPKIKSITRSVTPPPFSPTLSAFRPLMTLKTPSEKPSAKTHDKHAHTLLHFTSRKARR